MSVAPFAADRAAAGRLAERIATVGPAVDAAVEGLVADGAGQSTIAARDADELIAAHGLTSVEELALLALPAARRMARPPISGYRVGVVGIDAGGDLVLGTNLEFPGTDLGTTIHAEGFVCLRARRRGVPIRVLTLTEAHPCAHCRQTLMESADVEGLTLIDLLGHRLSIRDLYPWPFEPGALGMLGDHADADEWPGLELADGIPGDLPEDVAATLVDLGRRAHTPYSGAPSAAVVRLTDGRVLGGSAYENVAFNPTIPALQAALVEVVAARAEPAMIEAAWLARTPNAPVDPVPAARLLLGTLAPGATLTDVDWAPTGARP